MKLRKKVLSAALAGAMCLSLLPAMTDTAHAAGPIPEMPDVFQGDGLYITATPFQVKDSGTWKLESNGYQSTLFHGFHDGWVQVYREEKEMSADGYYTGKTVRIYDYADKNGNLLGCSEWENPPAQAMSFATQQSGDFYDGMCMFYDAETGKLGYMNEDGEVAVEPQFDNANPFRDGLARVEYNGDYYYIDRTGKKVLGPYDPFSGISVGYFGNGLAPYKGELNGEYFVGYIDKQGKPAITIYQGDQYDYDKNTHLLLSAVMDATPNDYASHFSDGYAILEDWRGGKTKPAYVVIDTSGREVGTIAAKAPAYYSVQDSVIHDGLLVVTYVDTADQSRSGEGAVVDIHGNLVLPVHSVKDWDGHYDSGVAPGWMQKATVIDKKGNVVIPVMNKILPEWNGSTGYDNLAYITPFDNGVTMMTVKKGVPEVGTSYYSYVLEVHQGTYTGSGKVYDAAAGKVTNGGGTTTPDPKPTGDQPSSWAKDQVNAAIEAKIVPESLQSKYTAAITRAEFCALATELYETVTGSEITGRVTFTDTTDVNVEKMAALGVVGGVGNGKFNPSGKLTREQAATMLARLSKVLSKPMPEQAATFSDSGKIASWAKTAVGQVQAADIMGGTGNNNFTPQGSYTREQSILTVMRLKNYVG